MIEEPGRQMSRCETKVRKHKGTPNVLQGTEEDPTARRKIR